MSIDSRAFFYLSLTTAIMKKDKMNKIVTSYKKLPLISLFIALILSLAAVFLYWHSGYHPVIVCLWILSIVFGGVYYYKPGSFWFLFTVRNFALAVF